jgi:cytochrome c biogenesis protein CcmG, thiol:disulfide interchange protein DsbE
MAADLAELTHRAHSLGHIWDMNHLSQGRDQTETPELQGISEAGDGGRTRDLWLGKPTLYQLSYTRAGPPILAFALYPVSVTRRRSLVPAVVGLLAAALVGLLVYGVVHGGDNTTLDDAVKSGQTPVAPGADLRRPMLNGGGDRSLDDYKGRVVVLNFWASWCEPCRSEAPILQRAQRRLASANLGTVLGATYEDARDDSLRFEREFKITYPSVRDIGTELARKYGTNKLPETFVLDRQGRIVAISRGQIGQAFLDSAIEKAQTS